MRQRAFVDASVLFAATHSTTGRARTLMGAGADAQLDLFVSVEVLDEVVRNLAKKSPAGIGYIDALLVAQVLSMVESVSDTVSRVAEVVEAKDAHVIAAAMSASASIVATYDRRHLLSQADVIW